MFVIAYCKNPFCSARWEVVGDSPVVCPGCGPNTQCALSVHWNKNEAEGALSNGRHSLIQDIRAYESGLMTEPEQILPFSESHDGYFSDNSL